MPQRATFSQATQSCRHQVSFEVVSPIACAFETPRRRAFHLLPTNADARDKGRQSGLQLENVHPLCSKSMALHLHHNMTSSPIPAASVSFSIDATAEQFCCLNHSSVGSGIFVAHRPSVIIGTGLRKYTAQLRFARSCWFALSLAKATFRLRRHDWHACTIDFDVHDRNVGGLDFR